jgi:hypothetical protein
VWEYEVVPVDPENYLALKAHLNQYGQQGWELIGIHEDRHSAKLWILFKRRTNA